MSSTAVERHLTELWETPKTLRGMLGTVDHKELGHRYIVTALIFLCIGGLEALLMRIQLSHSNNAFLSPEQYNQLFTIHGMTMIYWYAGPILSGFAIYLIPLMIGARDLAFPRLNAFTYWTFLFSGILLYIGPFLGQAPHAGWFAYVPYTEIRYSPSHGMDFYNFSLILLNLSTVGGAVNFIVTVLRHRAPGMTISRMPLFLWSTTTISFVALFAMPALTAANFMLELDRRWNLRFFDVALGGKTLLWQQVFWFFGHPWVYIIFLPATGMISMIIPVFSRRPIVGYPYVAAATVLTGLTGFGVWVHHMFTTGVSMLGMSFFSAASMTISLFTAIQVFAWLATIWRGRPVRTAAMYFAVGFIVLIIIGGLDGIATGFVPLDWQLNDTYWVIGHIHYVLVGANMFPVFAALYYWLPKMTGRMMSETLGKISFWIMFIGINVAFLTMHNVGVQGMLRRLYTYPGNLGWDGLNLIITVGSFILGFGILLTIINFFWSLRAGAVAGKNPWNADSLEWSTESPPPPYGSIHIPTVASRHPLWDEHEEEADPNDERVLDQGRFTLSTSWLDGVPFAIARMPDTSLTPLFAALGFFVMCGAFVFQAMWIVLGGLIFTLGTLVWWMRPTPRGETT